MTEQLKIEFYGDRVAYERRGVDPVALVGGATGTMLMLLALVSLPILANADVFKSRKSAYDQEPFEYVEARILKWGKPKDEQAMPDRIVPALPTAPEEVLPLDTNIDKPEPAAKPEKKVEPQRDAVSDDKLREVFDRARAFAEIQDDYVPEGHPDGVRDGDVTDPALASVGNTYMRRISRIFFDRFVIPTLIGDLEKQKLKTKVRITFDIDMSIVSVKVVKGSGNKMFDDQAIAAVERVRVEVKTLPEPPEAIAPRFFGGGVIFTFHGKDASYE